MNYHELETKKFSAPLALENISGEGIFTGYASVFGVIDQQKDVIEKGAFTKTLADRGGDIKLLWQHRQDEPIGVFDVIREDAKGLYIEGRLLLSIARAKEAYDLLKNGAIDGLSIGYTAKKYQYDKKNNLRVLKELDLFEISLVTFPSNAAAVVTSVKNTPKTIREFEVFLRDAGFSRKQAKTIASKAFDAHEIEQSERDALALKQIHDALDRVAVSIMRP